MTGSLDSEVDDVIPKVSSANESHGENSGSDPTPLSSPSIEPIIKAVDGCLEKSPVSTSEKTKKGKKGSKSGKGAASKSKN
ncbi:hypothetical protein E4U52_005243 [Claviceps spartinae]|nr:hypothetical protein E4U52_005243 [Claviceps spartinae]